MLELAFRFRHGCEVNRLSERHPDVVMAQWCNFRAEVLVLHTPDTARANVMRQDLAAMKGSRFECLGEGNTGDARMVVLRCVHRPGKTIDSVIEDAGCLYLPPVVYRGGWEHYRVLAFDERDARAMVRVLKEKGEVELTAKREARADILGRSFMIPAGELLEGLTSKQATALLAAIEAGYYRVPRRTRTEDIARKRQVPRTTFEEHVRKAESKVLHAVAPYVALYAQEAAQGEAKAS